MPKKPHENKTLPVLYASYYGVLVDIARRHGYALAIHGSLVNDMDLIAVPWTKDAHPPLVMLHEIYEMLGRKPLKDNPYDSVGEKPHGRTAYTIIAGGGGYFDISIMPVSREDDNAKA